jgi:hypothetical protein
MSGAVDKVQYDRIRDKGKPESMKVLSQIINDMMVEAKKIKEDAPPMDVSPYVTRDISKSFASIMQMVEKQPIYRLTFNNDSTITTECYDLIENFAPELNETYTNASELPEWVQQKVAVLMVLDPTQINKPVDGIGRRISRQVFWVYKDDGDDPRGEDQEGDQEGTG